MEVRRIKAGSLRSNDGGHRPTPTGQSSGQSVDRFFAVAFGILALAAIPGTQSVSAFAQEQVPGTVTIHWDKTIVTSRSTPTLQIVVNPMTEPGSPIHDATFQALKDLGADYVRYVPWLPYPRLAVAELEPPAAGKTSWDFTRIDPMTKDFLAATQGHPVILNFSTMPAWLFKSEKPITYPADADQPYWDYTQGSELVDPTGKQLGDYYGRLVSWYTKGGFTDENGVRHDSGYHFTIPVWEVLNEPEFEHKTTPQQYTERYDAIVAGIRRVSPETKFMGMALAQPSLVPEYFEYFLNPKNHRPGIPIDYISYHFYASPSADQTIADWQYTFFDQADGFLNTVRYAESIRKRLSPHTKVDLDELGVILADGIGNVDPKHPARPYPAAYWNLAGSMYAYLYIELAKLQIDLVGESQLVGYPTQFPSVTMMDWTNGKPNARYEVLKLLKDNFGPGDKLVETSLPSGYGSDIVAQGFQTARGKRLLLVNKRDKTAELPLPAEAAHAAAVDEKSGEGPAREIPIHGGKVTLDPFAVVVVSW
jgi:hypothetical protein